MPAVSHLDVLNAAQKKAATYGEPSGEKGWRAGPLLVIAGAGTGKTSTIAHRVAQLVTSWRGPGAAAAADLHAPRRGRDAPARTRYRARGHGRHARQQGQAMLQRLVWAGTFHSIGNRLLRHYARHLKLEPSFTVVDRGDSADLLDELRTQLGLASKEQRFPRKDTCLAIYSWRVNTQKSLHDTLEQQFPWCKDWEEDFTRLFRGYVERKQRYALLDYDDLLLYWHLMMSEPRLAQHVSANFDHVLVDEYQDTNKLQAEILLRPQARRRRRDGGRR
jgi:DNA helicase-2/ATP-dependent DNA helicase PcrA